MKKYPDSNRNTKTQPESISEVWNSLLQFLMLFLLLYSTAAQAETLTGRPYIIDSDTVRVSGKHIRLEGIDGPERNQRCRDRTGKDYDCGLVSTVALKTKIGKNSITCKSTTRDRYGRFLGICYLDNLDLNGWLVKNGYALAYIRYSRRYVTLEQEARKAGRGLWAGKFIEPWHWRKGGRL